MRLTTNRRALEAMDAAAIARLASAPLKTTTMRLGGFS
jgi:hypothetical protein